MKKYDIFISYRRKSATGITDGTYVARMLKMDLEHRGYSVFFDYNECTDGDFVDRILPAIRDSKVFLLVLTSGALTRCSNEHDWVRREIREALQTDSKIVPVSPDQGFQGWPADFPEELNALKTIQISDISTGALFEKSTDLLVENRFMPPRRRFDFRKIINIAAIALIVALAYFLFTNIGNTRKEKLLFVGSGTVDAYLSRNGHNVWEYPNGLYVAMPASSAWKILDEERTIGPYTTKGRQRTYFPILFSAIQAQDSNFFSSTADKQYFMNEIGRIGRVNLSNDSLQLLLYPRSAFNLDNDSIITGVQLAKLLRDESGHTKIFRTSMGSGTYSAYYKLMQTVGLDLNSINTVQFVRKVTTLSEYGNHFIILGSSIYQGAVEEPGFDESLRSNALFLNVKDQNNNYIFKPIFIYTMAYIIDGKKNEVVIPEPVAKFLEVIGHKPKSRVHGTTADLIFDI